MKYLFFCFPLQLYQTITVILFCLPHLTLVWLLYFGVLQWNTHFVCIPVNFIKFLLVGQFTKSSFISFKHAVSKILCTSQRYSNYVNSQLPPINQIPLDAHARQSHDFRWHVNTLGAVNSSETWSVRRVCTQSWHSTKSKFCLNSVFFF